MKKKDYMTPSLMVTEIATTAFLMVSGVGSEGIDYGGVDEHGTIEPSAPTMPDAIEW